MERKFLDGKPETTSVSDVGPRRTRSKDVGEAWLHEMCNRVCTTRAYCANGREIEGMAANVSVSERTDRTPGAVHAARGARCELLREPTQTSKKGNEEVARRADRR